MLALTRDLCAFRTAAERLDWVSLSSCDLPRQRLLTLGEALLDQLNQIESESICIRSRSAKMANNR